MNIDLDNHGVLIVRHAVRLRVKMFLHDFDLIVSCYLAQYIYVIYEWKYSGPFNIIPLMSQVKSSAGHICIVSQW